MADHSLKRCLQQVAGAALLGAALATPAKAQGPAPCTPAHTIVKQLEEKYGEIPVAGGLAEGGGLIQVFVSPTGGWTILSITIHGHACLVAHGQDWFSATLPKPGEPS